jgi:hypothetical protein
VSPWPPVQSRSPLTFSRGLAGARPAPGDRRPDPTARPRATRRISQETAFDHRRTASGPSRADDLRRRSARHRGPRKVVRRPRPGHGAPEGRTVGATSSPDAALNADQLSIGPRRVLSQFASPRLAHALGTSGCVRLGSGGGSPGHVLGSQREAGDVANPLHPTASTCSAER